MSKGYRQLYNGITGDPIHDKIYMVPNFYQRL